MSDLIKAMKWVAIGSVIAEYGAIMIKDASKNELKQRVNMLIRNAQSVQNWFTLHPSASEQSREQFKTQLQNSELILIAELIETVWGLGDDDLENIITAIKQNTNDN